MAGDFKLPGMGWEILSAGHTEITSCEGLFDIAFNYCLNQVVREYTRIAGYCKTILDSLFLSENVNNYSIALTEVISDHQTVSLDVILHHRKVKRPTAKTLIKLFNSADDTTLDNLEMSLDVLETSLLLIVLTTCVFI